MGISSYPQVTTVDEDAGSSVGTYEPYVPENDSDWLKDHKKCPECFKWMIRQSNNDSSDLPIDEEGKKHLPRKYQCGCGHEESCEDYVFLTPEERFQRDWTGIQPTIVVNGDFALRGYWTYGQDGGNGWSWSDVPNNRADCDGNQTIQVDLEQNVSAVADEYYAIEYTISNFTAGSVTPQIGGTSGDRRASDGGFRDTLKATGTGNLKFQASADFAGSISYVRAKKAQ